MIDVSASISIPVIRSITKLWSQWKTRLTDGEKKFLLDVGVHNRVINWTEEDGAHVLSILRSLEKKGVFQKGFASPNGNFINFVFNDNAYDLYKKLLRLSNSNIVNAIQGSQRIFPATIASSCGCAPDKASKLIAILEEEGEIVPVKSDNRGVLFWTN